MSRTYLPARIVPRFFALISEISQGRKDSEEISTYTLEIMTDRKVQVKYVNFYYVMQLDLWGKANETFFEMYKKFLVRKNKSKGEEYKISGLSTENGAQKRAIKNSLLLKQYENQDIDELLMKVNLFLNQKDTEDLYFNERGIFEAFLKLVKLALFAYESDFADKTRYVLIDARKKLNVPLGSEEYIRMTKTLLAQVKKDELICNDVKEFIGYVFDALMRNGIAEPKFSYEKEVKLEKKESKNSSYDLWHAELSISARIYGHFQVTYYEDGQENVKIINYLGELSNEEYSNGGGYNANYCFTPKMKKFYSDRVGYQILIDRFSYISSENLVNLKKKFKNNLTKEEIAILDYAIELPDDKNALQSFNYFVREGDLACKVAWGQKIATERTGEFYGGSLLGLISRIEYLKNLGITIIWIGPLNPAFASHSYDAARWDKVSVQLSGYKTEKNIDELFKSEENYYMAWKIYKLTVKICHLMGIEVIQDIALNHVQVTSLYFDEQNYFDKVGAKHRDSPYKNWFFQKKNGKYAMYDESVDELVKVTYLSQETKLSVIEMVKNFIGLGIDGFRLDVVDRLVWGPDSNTAFLTILNKVARDINPDFQLIGEVYSQEAIHRYNQDNCTLTGVMAYNVFMETSRACFEGISKHGKPQDCCYGCFDIFKKNVSYSLGAMDFNMVCASMAQCDNHDHFRIDLNTNNGLMEFMTMMMFPTTPYLYYGNEIGMREVITRNNGSCDPENRGTFLWELVPENPILEMVKNMIKYRKSSVELQYGEFVTTVAEQNQLCITRIMDKSQTIQFTNVSTEDRYYEFDLCGFAKEGDIVEGRYLIKDAEMTDITKDSKHGTPWRYRVEDGKIYVLVPAASELILRHVSN